MCIETDSNMLFNELKLVVNAVADMPSINVSLKNHRYE